MTLASKIIDFKISFVAIVDSLMKTIATKIFNYPQNIGMPIVPPYNEAQFSVLDYLSKLPEHRTRFPSPPNPTTLSQVFFGNYPSMFRINRTFYEHKSDGFYNFYVPNYKNIFFLPNWLSQWIQLTFDISVDTTPLEVLQQSLFLGLICFYFLLEFRMKLYWFLTINPYTRPWIYLIGLTDWIQDFMAGITPVILGVDLSATLLLGIAGKFADTLNHLVFTMPFLPSEGQVGKMMIGEEVKDVILYRYLPSLWYTHPIPDKLREFWYNERLDIFKFMKRNYAHLDIDFLPNRILKEMYEQQQLTKPVVENTVHEISSNVICYTSSMSHSHIENFLHLQDFSFFDVINHLST